MQRLRLLGNPPVSAKEHSPLRFGILGAARIGPNALITPAKSHPGVVVVAVAARSDTKAAKYASNHGITKSYSGADCYQQLLDDPEIDAVYNPLPNVLHYEWTLKALNAGKHVLVEKPMADTAAEAQALIELAEKKGLVLLEAIHYCYHPAPQRVREIIRSGELGSIKSIIGNFAIPSMLSGIFFLKDDIRYQYALGGGCMMDMGVYPLAAIRYFAESEPSTVTRADATGLRSDPTRVDRAMHATFTFPSSVTAELYVDFAMPGWGPLGLIPRMPQQSIIIALEGGSIEYYGFPIPHVRNYIKVVPKQGNPRTEYVYKRPDGTGEEWWSSYRYQLEAFVKKVRDQEPQYWSPPSEPVLQMKIVEQLYQKAGLPIRPTSTFFVEQSSVGSA